MIHSLIQDVEMMFPCGRYDHLRYLLNAGSILKFFAFDSKGIFILDQSHLVVPDNRNYVDYGQYYANLGELTKEHRF